MSRGYNLTISLPDGEPEGIRIVTSTSGGYGMVCTVFPRDKWDQVKQYDELSKAAVYILVGDESALNEDTGDNEDIRTIYIGESDGVKSRLENHIKLKEFWEWGIILTRADNSLNKAHIQWLEHRLVRRARELGRCELNNKDTPQEPTLSAHDKIDLENTLEYVYSMLPLVGLHVFKQQRQKSEQSDTRIYNEDSGLDTIVVPARTDGFNRVFLGKDCWHEIRISTHMIPKIKWIAGYQASPICAITHIAPVKKIEPYGDTGKYIVYFSEPAKKIENIPYADAPSGFIKSPRYTTHKKVLTAKKLAEVFAQ